MGIWLPQRGAPYVFTANQVMTSLLAMLNHKEMGYPLGVTQLGDQLSLPLRLSGSNFKDKPSRYDWWGIDFLN